MPDLWVPQHLRKAKIPTKIVFYKWKRGDSFYYTVGCPDNYPAPKGAEKIVCETAAEVEKYDQILRDQDRAQQEMTDEQRYEIEEPIWKQLRADLHNQMTNARNEINREFCRLALKQMDEAEAKRKEKRESFQHICGFEHGK
jgi:hypothetical protein